jgi:hypothetical protein
MPRKLARPEEIRSLITDVFGTDRRLSKLDRLAVATKKGVYRLTLDDDTTAMLYVWHPDENFWPTRDDGDEFGDPYGLEAYVACKDRYDEAGVRTADTYAVDNSHRHYPADVAVVEHLPNGTLEELLDRDPANAGPALDELAGFLAAMRALRSPEHGRIARIAGETADQGRPPQQVVFEQALRNLDESASSVPAIAAAHDRITTQLYARLDAVAPRAEFSLVHGELGPDHVLLDRDGRPALVDLEGSHFTDAESEHVFVRMRFGEHYRHLRVDGLDQDRLELYQMAMWLSLVAGPLRMVDGDHPEREFMREIATANTARLLDAL